MNRVEFVAALARRMGGIAESEAERAARAVLKAFGEALDPTEAQAIERDLPEIAQAWLGRPARAPLGITQLADRVQYAEHVRTGVALEHVELVCQLLADALRPDTCARLARDLPAQLGVLLARSAPAPVLDPPTSPRAPEDSQRKLSSARPQSQNPLSEARPERAHQHSVARAANPHGDTKLASASGTTQERQRRTLATGEPGGHTPPAEPRAK